jgi:DNA polymerase I
MFGLMGDASDNIPGLPGVGEKRAKDLLKEYGSLEGVLENADNIKGKLGEGIRANKELGILSKKLATIITNVPTHFDAATFILEEPNKEALTAVLNRLEFKTLGKRLLGEDFSVSVANKQTDKPSSKKASAPAGPDLFGLAAAGIEVPNTTNSVADLFSSTANINTAANTTHNYITVNNANTHKQLIDTLNSATLICFDTETTGIDANEATCIGMSFSTEAHTAYYLPLPLNNAEALEILNPYLAIFNDAAKTWVGHNIKYDLLILQWMGISIKGTVLDTMLAHYLVDPDGRRSMDLLSEQYLNYKPISITSLIGEKGKNQGNMKDVAIDKVTEYAAEDADITLQLYQVLNKELNSQSLQNLYTEVEAPLVKVLTHMEHNGINLDTAFLKDYSTLLNDDIIATEQRVYESAGMQFNIASPKQLGEVLFDRLKLDDNAKKTGKSGQYATGEEVLSKLVHKHPVIDDILNYRELTKLKSTYVDALPALINTRSGKIHTSYNQAVAVTGRLSSNNPNLQNIPIRTARGREIRKAFIPANSEHVLLSADYSQIELRIIAALANDANMIAAFKAGKDIHTATAAQVYKVAEADVTKEQRRNAKAVNFGIIYGQSAFGLADNLGISRTEAKQIIDSYWEQFGSIKTYMNQQINFAREHGYVQTILGRRRWLKDINSNNFTVKGFAERNAVNMPIQGSAADMIKVAMIRLHTAMQTQGFKSKMVLQVHDELVFDALKTEVDALSKLIKQEMEAALPLPNGVPCVAEVGQGNNWLEAH